jgi:hypothetical protein
MVLGIKFDSSFHRVDNKLFSWLFVNAFYHKKFSMLFSSKWIYFCFDVEYVHTVSIRSGKVAVITGQFEVCFTDIFTCTVRWRVRARFLARSWRFVWHRANCCY